MPTTDEQMIKWSVLGVRLKLGHHKVPGCFGERQQQESTTRQGTWEGQRWEAPRVTPVSGIFMLVWPPVDKSILTFLLEVAAGHFPEPLAVRCDQVLAKGVCPGPPNFPDSPPCVLPLSAGLTPRVQQETLRRRGWQSQRSERRSQLPTLKARPRAPHPTSFPLHCELTENHSCPELSH